MAWYSVWTTLGARVYARWHRSSLKGLLKFSRYSIIVALLFFAPSAFSQTTSVSATITDASGQSWNYGSFSFSFKPSPSNPSAQYTFNGVPFNVFQVISGSLNASGAFSGALVPSNTSITPSGSTWVFQACPASTTSCSTKEFTITGASQSLTASFTPPAIVLDLGSSPPNGASAYSDSEVIGGKPGSVYYNINGNALHICSVAPFPPCTWIVSTGGAITSVFGRAGAVISQTGDYSFSQISGTLLGSQFGPLTGDVTTSAYTATLASSGVVPGICGSATTTCALNIDAKGRIIAKTDTVSNPGVLVSPITTPNPLAFDVDVAFKGSNPYVDVRRFGVRAVLASTVPAVPGITASCTSGSSNVTLSSASTFQNGDGVALYGCGPSMITAPAAPTVTPVLAAAQTGTQLYVNAPAGATQYCYQLVARTSRGATNVSPETCTAAGQASLGLQTNSITSCTLILNVMNCLTSAPHGLAVGAQIVVANVGTLVAGSGVGGQANNIPFNGWFTVATIPDNTHFTVNLLTDTRNGAVAAGTGGTVNYWNAMQIKATETSGNFQYYVYGRVTGGTKTLLGTMWPQNSAFLGDATYLSFGDFGSPVTTFPNPPFYIPMTVPTLPTNDMLSATIVSGAGTTSLILSTTAGNTNSGQTILFDDAVTFLNAAIYATNIGASTSGPLMLPWMGNDNVSYVFNSPISLGSGFGTTGLQILQKGTVTVNEPITLSFVSWRGEPASNQGISSFASQVTPSIVNHRASPAIYAPHTNYFFNLGIGTDSANGTTNYIQDDGGIPSAGTFRNVGWGLSTATSYSNMAAVFRAGAGFDFENTLILSSQNNNLIATTPGMYFNLANNASFRNLNVTGVGIATRVNAAGGFLIVDNVYSQGNYEPYFSFVNSTGSNFAADIRQSLFDTTSVPLVANYGGAPLTLIIHNPNASSNDPLVTGSYPPGSSGRTSILFNGSTTGVGTPQNLSVSYLNEQDFVNDGTFGRGQLGIDRLSRSVSIGPGYSLFTTTGNYPAPTCPVSAGGSVPVGTFTYQYAPIFPNGSQGMPSLICSATTNSGQQTVTLNWTAVPGVTQYDVFRNGVTLLCTLTIGATLVDTFASACGTSGGAIGAGGPAGMHGDLIWAQTMRLGGILISSLPTASSANAGQMRSVTDSTAISAEGQTCVGGGSVAALAFSNGVAWKCF